MTQRKPHRNSKAWNPIKKILQHWSCFLVLITYCVPAEAAPSKFITKFPFTLLTGGIVIVQARLDHNLDTLNFVLDTGSGGISLDSSTVKDLKLPVTPSNRTIRGIAGIRNISFVMNQKLLLPRLLVDSLNFHINDYSILSSVYGMKIDGIIGFSFFNRYIVKIDYDNQNIEVWEPGEYKYTRRGWLLYPLITNIPVFDAEVNDAADVKSKFYFDTGAGLCLLLSERFVADSALLKKGSKIVLTQAEGLGGKKLMKITTVKTVQFGPYRFKKVPTYIFEDEFNVTSYPRLGGLVGNDILRRFNLVINYGRGIIHLTPNTHFSEGFDYSYVGLGIFMVENDIVVEDVIEDSPGAKAGFKSGDIIIAVGTNFSKNIQAYRALLQVPGTKLKIVITRNGSPMLLNLKVGSITGKK